MQDRAGRGWLQGVGEGVLSVVLDYGLLFVSHFGLCDFIRGGVCTMIAVFPIIRRSHFISFTGTHGTPKYKIGLGRGTDGRVGKGSLEGGRGRLKGGEEGGGGGGDFF